MPETLSYTTLSPPRLDTRVVGSRILIYDSVDSTNARALQIGGHGTVVVADSQTAGRGRRGSVWHSAPGLGLWFSVVFEDRLEGLPFTAPLAVRAALAPYCPADIKWPNDVLVGGRKVCGMLVEQRQGLAAVGIGINVHHRSEDFPPELRDRATSVELEADRPCSRGTLLQAVLTHLDRWIMVIESGQGDTVRRAWADACNVVGRHVRRGAIQGTVTAMDDTGALTVETSQGPKRIVLGDRVEFNGA